MITMQAQGLAGAPQVELMEYEDLEDIEHEFPQGDILGLDTPSLGPAIYVQELLLECGRRRADREACGNWTCDRCAHVAAHYADLYRRVMLKFEAKLDWARACVAEPL